MIKSLADTVTLNNGVQMPGLGLGVFKIGDGSPVKNAVKAALNLGYKSFDTAAMYRNEEGVGEAIKESGTDRKELFLTTKVWNDEQGYDKTIKSFERSLKYLQTDYVDLFLIHWPIRTKFVETWKALETLYEEKRVRAIGVCNFYVEDLKLLLDSSKIVPVVNQIELHPLLTQLKIREFCRQNGIAVEAWGPLLRGNLDVPLFNELAEKHKNTKAQIVLRWHIQNEIIVIPKTVHPHRLRENIDIFDFSLDSEEMKMIDSLNENKRFGPAPEDFND
ncbi:MAG: aldo/keto reductase [Sphaerochaetaceae bacterium]